MSPSTSLPDDEQSSQPAEVSYSDIDDDEQKFEEEEEEEDDEIEELEGDDEQEDGVEEEVEEEEEEDDEVEEVEEEEEEDDEEDENNVDEEDENNVDEEDEEMSDSPIEADDDHKDDGQEVKSERYDGQLESASSFPGNSKDLLSNALAAVESSSDFKLSGSSKELLAMKKEEIGVESGKHMAFSQNFGSRELMVDKDTGTVLQKKLKTYSKQHSNRSPSGNSVIMDAKITNSPGLIGKEEVVDATRMSEVSGRVSHGLLYVEDENKQKEIQSRDDKKRKASSMDISETGTRSLSSGVEIKGGNKSPAIICDFFLKGWCIKGSSCRFLHVKDHVNDIHPQCRDVSDANCEKELHLGEGLKDTSEKSGSPSLHDPRSPPVGNRSGFSPDRIESQELMEGEASYNLLHQRKELHVGTSPAIKDVGRAREHQSWPTNDNSIPRLVSRGDSAFRNSLHPELSSSGHTISSSNYDTGNLSSHPGHDKDPESTQRQHVHDYPSSTLNRFLLPTWTSSQPFNYSKFNSCSLGSRSPSFLQSSSFSRPELDNLPSTSASLHYAELKPKVFNDWEPSVPFRPSFFIQSVIPSLGSQYDPLRDSFELPKLGNISTRASLFCHGSSIVNSSNPQMHGDSNTGTLGLAYNDDTNSVSSHNTYHEKTVPKEWNPSCLSDVEDIAKTGKINGYIDSRYHQDGSRFRNDMAREIKDMNVECDTDGGVQQESKALKHFRGALVELVKDLLKPKWREGQLSKDAHKKIVKKSVDKILSASEPNQVPSTEEALKQYLCSSHHKIVKLVEGYADKYGKT